MPRVKAVKIERTQSAPAIGNKPKTRSVARSASCDRHQLASSSPLHCVDKHIPRPLNCFLLYRKFKVKELEDAHYKAIQKQQKGGLNHAKRSRPQQSKMSQDIAAMWHAEDDETRERFVQLAEEEKENHKKQYPDYQYRPQPKKNKRRRRQYESPEHEFVPYMPMSAPCQRGYSEDNDLLSGIALSDEHSDEEDPSQSQNWPPIIPQETLNDVVHYKSEPSDEIDLYGPSSLRQVPLVQDAVVPSDPFFLFEPFYDASKDQSAQQYVTDPQPGDWDYIPNLYMA
ncbi:hypothetical protein QCA50_010532 [Cerrena zonata]|uniref:HMG box domain-containing protein n=1 Tax=Cerrena zonata TaxID=2478898 RepID=A0AAW0FZ07_9APHY